LCGLLDPNDFVKISVIPAASKTALTPPPAINPVPGEAGFNKTLPAPNFPIISCATVPLIIETFTTFFFASSIPFDIASVTSLALPRPTPTHHFRYQQQQWH
jgi:hypothetical protein